VADIFANMNSYSLRPATKTDFAFLQKLHKLTLKPYVEQIWGWNDLQQEKLLCDRFDPAKLQVIQIESEDVGVLQVEEKIEQIFLANILLLPEWQGKGLGSKIVLDIIVRAGNLPVTLTVLKPNPAKSLYERLGFVTTNEDEVRYFMKRIAF